MSTPPAIAVGVIIGIVLTIAAEFAFVMAMCSVRAEDQDAA